MPEPLIALGIALHAFLKTCRLRSLTFSVKIGFDLVDILAFGESIGTWKAFQELDI